MSNTVGYTIGCVTPVRFHLTQGEDVTGDGVGYAASTCAPGCWNGDYRDRRYWAQIPRSATTVTGGTDYYGALAPTLFYYGGGTYREICPTVCFCEGPVEEGATISEFLGRYETRWMALLSEGLVYYGREDGTLIQAPLALFQDPLPDTATHIALAFDANARPVFAYEDGGMIYLRRYVAETPTFHSWTGVNPCLFFNGVVESDDALTDVVCYYLTESGGRLYARIQRENFGISNLVLENEALGSLLAVDRGRGVVASYMVVELSGKRIFAAIYPPWPAYTKEPTQTTGVFSTDGEYTLTVLVQTVSEPVAATGGFSEDGVYMPVTVTVSETDPVGVTSSFGSDGLYFQTLIPSGTETDAATSSATLGTDGLYFLAISLGGSYTDGVTSTASFNSDGAYL